MEINDQILQRDEQVIKSATVHTRDRFEGLVEVQELVVVEDQHGSTEMMWCKGEPDCGLGGKLGD